MPADQNQQQGDDPGKERTPLGQRLRAARERKGVALVRVAQTLHLDPDVLEHMEADEFEALGAPVYAKGHLRKYAHYLDLPDEDLLEDYEHHYQDKESPPLVAESLALGKRRGKGRWISLALALLLAAGWWYLLSGPDDEVTVTTRDPESAQAPGAMAEELETAADVALRPEPVVDVAEEREAPPVATPAEEPVESAPGEGGETGPQDDSIPGEAVPEIPSPPEDSLTLAGSPAPTPEVTAQFSFAEDSWIEVYDVAERRLVYQLGRSNTLITATGEAPLRVFLGNAAGVAVQVGGEDFALPAGSRRGDTARFSVPAGSGAQE